LSKFFDGKKIDENYQKLDLPKTKVTDILVRCYWDLQTSQAIHESWMKAIFNE